MSSGRQNKLVGQTGEYLVAAELSRHGYISTTFTGNVPDYDIIASNEKGRHISIQGKTSNSNSWQFGDITRFCEITFSGKQQIIGKKKNNPIKRLVVIFVSLNEERKDRYFLLSWNSLRNVIVSDYKAYLKKHNGKRPKTWNSLHCAISIREIVKYENKWEVIGNYLN
jgi:hypothetical protein